MKTLFRCIGSIFLMCPISCCISKTCDNSYLSVGLIILFAIGLSFVKFRFEE